MKKKLIGLLVIILCFVLSGYAFAESLKIGYLNMRKVFYEYKKTKEFNNKLAREEGQIKEEIEKKTNEVRKLRDEIELLSKEAKQKKEPALRQKMGELDEFRRSKVDGILRKKDEMFKEIRENILDVAEKYAKKNRYDVVFDEALFVYSLGKYDITDEIIKRLNK